MSDIKDFKKSPYDQAAIVGYNRLESSPVSSDYAKSLQASVHDALWMLTRQWQMGEFEAEDAGSAIKARVLAEHLPLSQTLAGDGAPLPHGPLGAMPLEAAVEREFATPDLFLRIESGNLLKQIIKEHAPGEFLAYMYHFKLGYLQSGFQFDEIDQDPTSLDLFEALKNKTLDGYRAYSWMVGWESENDVQDGLNKPIALKIQKDFVPQFEWLYGKVKFDGTITSTAWQNEQLEYKFAISSPLKDTLLSVDQYSSGSLDWYDFDLDQLGIGGAPSLSTFVPAPVVFEGMPKPRWWEMEDSAINFGDVNAKKTDLPTLLFLEFALIYGNDWMLVPYPMEVNTLCRIQGILVTDVFGCHTYIPPVDTASNTAAAPWEKWAMFRHGGEGAKTGPPAFYLAPTLLKSMESQPIESVDFLRDEMANLVWAFENTIPGAMGSGQRSVEMAQREAVEPLSVPSAETEPSFYYKLATELPFYQVPYLPVELKNDPTHTQIRLQRGKMPGSSDLTTRGLLLRETPFVREEEVPRAGVRVTRKWQRARWIDGAVFQWVGREKETGKGEGNSGLQFDVLSHKPEYKPIN